MSANNGDSYQTQQHNVGSYQEIPNGSSSASGNRLKNWLAGGAAILATLGVAYGTLKTMHVNPSTEIHRAFSTLTANSSVATPGKLKLFDDLSTFDLSTVVEQSMFGERRGHIEYSHTLFCLVLSPPRSLRA
jgi:hypothetical protein